MTISINTTAAQVTRFPLFKLDSDVQTAMQRLSTGSKINATTDNVLALSSQYRLISEIKGLNQAAKNAAVGIAINDTADAALLEISEILQRLRELAVQGSSAAITSSTRVSLTSEATALSSLITKLAADTKYDGIPLLDGTFTTQSIQIGANSTNGSLSHSIETVDPASLGAYVSEGYTRVPIAAAGTEPANNTTTNEDITVGSSTIEAVSAESAKDVAVKINAVSAATGVTATAETYAHLFSTSNSSETYSVEINGTSTGNFAISSTSVSAAVTAINSKSGTTGVTATATSDFRVLLHDIDGDDITIENETSSQANLDVLAVKRDGTTTQGNTAVDLAGAGGNDATRVVGTLRLVSDSSFSVTQSGTSTLGYLVTGTATRSAVSSIDLTTSVKSGHAIETLDSALNQVSAIRSNLAANSQVLAASSSTNLGLTVAKQAGLSDIQDADYAAETAALAKAMMLRKANVALLAQAKAEEELVLTLLHSPRG